MVYRCNLKKLSTKEDFFSWIEATIFKIIKHPTVDFSIESILFLKVMRCVEEMLGDCECGDGEAFIRFLIKETNLISTNKKVNYDN